MENHALANESRVLIPNNVVRSESVLNVFLLQFALAGVPLGKETMR